MFGYFTQIKAVNLLLFYGEDKTCYSVRDVTSAPYGHAHA